MPEAARDDVELLRAAGLRVTAPRVAVLEVLAEAPHADADFVATAARARLGALSTQAVYDVLGALTRAGLLRRFEPAGSAARYERRTGDNHHHVVCRSCGAVDDVDCATGSAPCLSPSDTHGFDVDEAEVTWWGLCARCRPQRSQTAAAASACGIPVPHDSKEGH
ncbi:Fe2+/Zn2+ uptake regulation protein [Gaiella occulta]|uniref:Fe2+/Zn2+ uptake regulation protein n=1 Tax=Gaiella occulta TaxID=1002870 RepID=A0A7M2YXP3_9ACTN|nr:Fur family transcriptional regulator [Gaiella occulta]RDI74500.1 Fe2+/Zn2+ uptake regulation protein [Gaiella occulta]